MQQQQNVPWKRNFSAFGRRYVIQENDIAHRFDQISIATMHAWSILIV